MQSALADLRTNVGSFSEDVTVLTAQVKKTRNDLSTQEGSLVPTMKVVAFHDTQLKKLYDSLSLLNEAYERTMCCRATKRSWIA
jgi:hypothetical protein